MPKCNVCNEHLLNDDEFYNDGEPLCDLCNKLLTAYKEGCIDDVMETAKEEFNAYKEHYEGIIKHLHSRIKKLEEELSEKQAV